MDAQWETVTDKNNASCSSLPRYRQRGSTGGKGTQYQSNILAIALLNGLKRSEEWRLSTENVEADKLNDLVFESSQGNVFLQCKHKKHKNTITSGDLLSSNPGNSDFSLPNYFISYMKVKRKFQFNIDKDILVICTNADVKIEDERLKQKQNLPEDHLLYFEGVNSTIYTFNESILPELKQNIVDYRTKLHSKKTSKSKISHNKKKKFQDELSDDDIREFLNCLRFLGNYSSEENLDTALRTIIANTALSENLDSETVSNFFYKKMQHWTEENKGVYHTKAHTKAFLGEIHSNEYCKRLEKMDVGFDNDHLPVTDLNTKICHIVPQEHYIIPLLKCYRTLQKKIKKKFLLIDPNHSDDTKKLIIDTFKMPLYVYLIIACHDDSDDVFTREICNRIKGILDSSKFKKLILVSAKSSEIAKYFNKYNGSYKVVQDDIQFCHINKGAREKLLMRENVLFQGTKTCLKKLLSTLNETNLSGFIDTDTLVKLVTGKEIEVGAKVEALSDDIGYYYVHRTFNQSSTVITQGEIREEAMWDFNSFPEKTILISDSPGMGKTTVLTYLAQEVKQKYPNLWVLQLNINNYTRDLYEFQAARRVAMSQLLRSLARLQTAFEEKLFSLPGRVLLMIDGVDEISPDYEDIVVNLIRHCNEDPRFVKVYVSTRSHLREKLSKILSEKVLTLNPFSKSNQCDFLYNYWRKKMSLTGWDQKERCQLYAKMLIKKISEWINERDKDMLAEIPLQTRMIAEVFQEKGNVDIDLGDWQGCREFINSHEINPILPHKINLVKLYRLFMSKKRDIFIHDKSMGNVKGIFALNKTYKRCQRYHHLLALETILGKTDAEQLNYYRHLRLKNRQGSDAVDVGIVQQVGGKYSFTHRSFAEFYVAECLVLELKCESHNRHFQKFFLDHVLYVPRHRVVRSFLDNFLGEGTISDEIFDVYCSLDRTERLYNGEASFIHTLCEEGCMNLVKFFLKYHSQAEKLTKIDRIRDRDGETLLHYACRGQPEMVGLLLRYGADVDAQDIHGNAPLHSAVSRSKLDVARLLLARSANIHTQGVRKRTALHVAAKKSNLKMVKLLLKHGSDPNIADARGYLALHHTAKRSDPHLNRHRLEAHANLEMVRELVKSNSNVNKQSVNGSTALHLVACHGSITTFKYLIESGADITLIDRRGRTALHYAAEASNCNMIGFLLNTFAVDLPDGSGNSALHLATHNGCLDVVKFLVKNGADVNAKNHLKQSVLHEAAKNDCLHIARYLVQEGAEINAKDCQGNTVLHSRCLSFKAMKYLIEEGVAFDVRGPLGKTVLHCVIEGNARNKIDYIRVLVGAGLDVNSRDDLGKTALSYAYDWDVATYLRQNGAHI